MGKLIRIAGLVAIAAWQGAAQSRPDASRGNELFDEQCSQCHYSDRFDRKVGPGLKWLYSSDKLESNGQPVNDANVLDKVNRGGKGMPAYQNTLSAEDKANLLAYLRTI